MVSEPGDAVGKSWPKESRLPLSRFRGTCKIDRVVDLIRNRPQVDFGFFADACFDRFGKPQRTRLGSGTISANGQKISRIEVVAFDSTFIEVTTDIEGILENLRDWFGATMVVE